MINGTTWLVVELLWEANKDSFWELGDQCHHVTLEQMLAIYDGESLADVSGEYGEPLDDLKNEDQESLDLDLRRHLETIGYWYGQLEEFLETEQEIPTEWALSVSPTLSVDDGNHRLVAAHLLELETLPCKLTRANPSEPRVLFLDLDETLLRTSRLESASDLFLGGVSGRQRLTSENKQRTREFYAALRDYEKGDIQEVALWAAEKNIQILKSDLSPDTWATKQRPGLLPFLRAVREMFDEVNILTAGHREFQMEVLQALGLVPYFDNIYGRQESSAAHEPPPHGTGPLTTARNPILVDDNGNLGSMGWNSKMIAMGVLDQRKLWELDRKDYKERDEYLKKVAEGRFVTIKCWFGAEDDNALEGVLHQLEELI